MRAVRAAAIAGDRAAVEAFFSEEYAVNTGIATFPKPWVSLIDGVCMGVASVWPSTTARAW